MIATPRLRLRSRSARTPRRQRPRRGTPPTRRAPRPTSVRDRGRKTESVAAPGDREFFAENRAPTAGNSRTSRGSENQFLDRATTTADHTPAGSGDDRVVSLSYPGKRPAVRPVSRRGSFHGRVNAVHVVVVIQRVEKIGDLFFLCVGESDEVLREIAKLGGGYLPAGPRKEFGDCVEVFDFRDVTGADVTFGNFLRFQRFHVLRAGFNCVGFRVARFVFVRGFHHAQAVEEETDAAGRTERTGAKEMANLGRGAVAVVGEALDDDRDFVRRESFVCHQFINHFFTGLAGAFPDGALDGVARYRGLARRLQRRVQPRVEIGVRPSQFRGHHDFANEFADDLAALRRIGHATGLFPLRAHAVCLPAARVKINCYWTNPCEDEIFSLERERALAPTIGSRRFRGR